MPCWYGIIWIDNDGILFCNLDGEIDGAIFSKDLSWEADPKEEIKKYKVGDQVKVKIISSENEKVALSIREVTGNPFDEIKNASSVNSGCSQNKQPQYLIKLHLASGESINVGTCNWFLSNGRVAEWNNYITNTLHQPKA